LPCEAQGDSFHGVKPITYCVYREDNDFVAQCLNVDVSSFGATREEANSNLREALELYFEGAP
jgi:predicted RNase H-like HicB family nuclease